MIRLIVNSDDYCRSGEVSRGVREAHLHGIVTSTTCMMNMPTTVDDVKIALTETPRLGMGVHLVLTTGKPILPREKVQTLTTPDGEFLKLEALVARLGEIDPVQAKAEWRTQIEAFVTVAGRKPTHLDSHHHSSYFTEGLFRAMLELAQEYSCAIRLPANFRTDSNMVGLPPEVREAIQEYAPRLMADFKPRCPDAFYATFYDDHATREEMLRIINNLTEGTFEMMCHPGYADSYLVASSNYAQQREAELAVLTDPSVIKTIRERDIQLISFADL